MIKLDKIFSVQGMFVLFAALFGVIYLLLTPPFYDFDECRHFWRAYQISEGHIISERQDNKIGGYLPKSLYVADKSVSELFRNFNNTEKSKFLNFPNINIPLNKNDRIFIRFPSSALYSPIPYLPQSVGILIGNIFDATPLILMYLGRIANLIVWIILVYHAIKTTPVFKYVFFLLALTPIILFQAASLSADAVTNGLSFVFIALLLKYAYDNDKLINYKNTLLITLLSVLIALSKQAYLVLILLFFLIPIKRFKNKKAYFLALITVIAASIASFGIWTLVIGKVYIPQIPGVSPINQLKFIITHPFAYFIVLYNTFISPGGFVLLWETFGKVLGWPLHVDLPIWIFHIYIPFTIIFSLCDNEDSVMIKAIHKVIYIVAFAAGVGAVTTLFYLSWTRFRGPLVEGLQGRYFIPFTPLVALLFYNQKCKFNKKYLLLAGCAFVFIVLSATTYYIYSRYYIA